MSLRPQVVAQALAVAGVAALLALLVWKIAHHEDSIASEVRAGERPPAPTFVLPRLAGDGTLSLASLRGRPVVLNFWQSTCAPCKGEAPVLQRGWERYRRQGVVFVGLAFWDLSGDARHFVRRFGVTYPNVYDGPGTMLEPYGVTGAPETFFIDARGRVVEHRVGPLTSRSLSDGVEGALTG